MEEKYKKIEWGEEDVISFPNNEVRKARLTLENLKRSVVYDRWGSIVNQNFASRLKITNNLTSPSNKTGVLSGFSQWFEDGIDCKIMRAYDAKGWRNGKIRVKLNVEFELWEETDESDSPLDSFRENQS